MNHIIIAYAPENVSLARYLDQKLSPVGIPFHHFAGDLDKLSDTGADPVMLLVTDQLLTNATCLHGLFPVVQELHRQNRLWVILADTRNNEGEIEPMHLDRMANVLHYMKHWQDQWIAVSDRYQLAEAQEKQVVGEILEQTRSIANQVGDLIGLFREAGFTSWDQLLAQDFELLFQRYGLMEWHVQYRRQAAREAEHTDDSPSFLPEVHLSGGLLAPEPLKDTFPLKEDGSTAQKHEQSAEEKAVSMSTPDQQLMDQSVKDAWFWLGKGHIERGFDLFKTALEQEPGNTWLKEEYQKALAQFAPSADPVAPEPQKISQRSEPADEVKSYDLMGDMAHERGDYLFAKYCWDRVAELDSAYPNIYRKLGLMTSEHLKDYRETALIYLRKALESNPDDAEVQNMLSKEASADAGSRRPVVTSSEEPLPGKKTEDQLPQKELVLITGATSGIGKATAEIFARNGYRLILTGRRMDRLEALKNQFETSYGTEVLLLPFDVRDHEAVDAALTNLPDTFKQVDILVNNAGLAKGLSPIHEGNLEHWETMIDTNIKGLLYVTRLISPGMVERRKGHIINICSSAGREAYPNGNVYCATKFAVDALTKSMRFDLHPYDIRVSQVSPGHVEETEFALNRFDGDTERAKIYQDFQPLKSSDVAEAIYFLATRPPYVNIVDIQMFATQQASSMVINRNGRRF
jgi:NADP-dependent 3-hydroxy acid dehydrogenase YdfG